MLYNRRTWLQQSLVAIAGLTVPHIAPGAPKSPLHDKAYPGDILLNSNENAYGPSPMAKKAMLETLGQSNRYPDELVPVLKEKIAAHLKVAPENVLLGAGSSEIIGISCLHVCNNKKKIILAEPGYKSWNGQAASFGANFAQIALTLERKNNLEAMASALDNQVGMMYVCNPNNPVGTYVPVDQLRNFALEVAKKTMVFIDEAYTEYPGIESLATLAVTHPNMIVAKTFSKIYGLAGARVGYAIAHPDTIKKLARHQSWANASISIVSAAAAIASLDDNAFVNDCREKTATARSICYETFKELSLDYIPSSTNFMLFNIDKIGQRLSQEMQAKKIFIQSQQHFGGEWCRVSMGTVEEMKQFCTALKQIV